MHSAPLALFSPSAPKVTNFSHELWNALAGICRRFAATQPYLTFLIGGGKCGIRMRDVTKVIACPSVLHEKRGMPDFVRGVIDLHGTALPVIDLSARIREQETIIGPHTRIVVVKLDGRQHIGVMVDVVSDIVELVDSECKSLLADRPGILADCVVGIAGSAGSVGKFVIVLDIQRLLSVEERVALVE